MKTLRERILESILSDAENIMSTGDNDVKRYEVIKFLEDNYATRGGKEFSISAKPNKNGLFEVSYDGDVYITNRELNKLTNDLFMFKTVNFFSCAWTKINSLEGAPIECNTLDCSGSLITDLIGCPKKIHKLNCTQCGRLKTLKGCSKNVRELVLAYCYNLKSLNGVPRSCYDLNTDGLNF